MPLKIGKKIYRSQKDAVRTLKRTRPDIKNPDAYISTIEKTIEQRRSAKSKKK